MTNEQIDFDHWYDLLVDQLSEKGYHRADLDAAKLDYDLGMTPEESAKSFIEDWEN